jgi:sensor domain CHASE-containing protein
MFGLSTLNTVEEFELDDVRSKVAFAKKILNREQENLKAYLYDRGFWNDTYYFFQGKDKQKYVAVYTEELKYLTRL